MVERLERRRLVDVDEAVVHFGKLAVDVVPPPLVVRYVVHADEALGARGAERVQDARVVTWHPQIEDLRPVRKSISVSDSRRRVDGVEADAKIQHNFDFHTDFEPWVRGVVGMQQRLSGRRQSRLQDVFQR